MRFLGCARWRRILVRLPLVAAGIGACARPPQRARVDFVAALPAPETISSTSDVSQTVIVEDPNRIVRSDTGRLEFPRIRRNFCGGEYCSYDFSVVACTTLVLRSADSGNAPEVGHVNAGDTVVVETGKVHIPVPGLAIMRRDHVVSYEAAMTAAGIPLYDSLRLAAGDTLLLLEYRGEGFWAVGHEGRWAVVEEFWAGPVKRISGRLEDELPAILIKAPEVIHWMRLRSRSGSTGWWRWEESKTIRVDPEWPQSCPRRDTSSR